MEQELKGMMMMSDDSTDAYDFMRARKGGVKGGKHSQLKAKNQKFITNQAKIDLFLMP